MSKINKILIGTNNKGKYKELSRLLPKRIKKYNPKKFNIHSPKETGTSFEENSFIKASHFSKKTNLIFLSDDSGLEVKILKGKPGIYSSRWNKSKKNLISRSIGWASAGFYMTPMEDGIRAAGTVEIAGLKKPMNKKRLELIEKTSRKILPQLGEIKNYWMGFRPTLPDSLPVFGKSKKCENVYYAFGHQHLGLSLGAVTGKVIQSLVEDKRSNINLEPFNPYRF